MTHNSETLTILIEEIRLSSSEGLLGHDEVEVLEGDLLTVGGCALKHFFQFLRAHGLSELLGYTAKVMKVDCGRLVIIEEVKDASDAFLGLFVA
jgi:hypothetical protein